VAKNRICGQWFLRSAVGLARGECKSTALTIGYNQHPRRENKPYENTSGLDFYFF
jgi:hypothetical protein